MGYLVLVAGFIIGVFPWSSAGVGAISLVKANKYSPAGLSVENPRLEPGVLVSADKS
jgi:hypothetical protein